jgi:isoleucyl-tRNA synthetase
VRLRDRISRGAAKPCYIRRMIETTFNPKQVEPLWSKAWEDSGAFKPKADPKADPFCIVIPPPNVTGSLHMGHALNNTCRTCCPLRAHARRDVLWQPGTDHAGIATQMVVERQLDGAGKHRPPRPWAATPSRARLGVEGRIRRHHRQPAARLGASLRLAARALHHGRGLSPPCARCSSSSTSQG